MNNRHKAGKRIWNEVRLILIIIITALIFQCLLYKGNYCIFKNFLIPFTWLKSVGIFLSVYFLIRIYKDWLIDSLNFLKNTKILQFLLIIVLPIGIIFFAYSLFFPEISIITKSKDVVEIMARIVEADKLIGFYASLIAIIGVLIAISGRIVWKKLQEAQKLTEKMKDVEDRVNFLAKENTLADWAKEKIDNLGLHSFKITNFTSSDLEKLKEIKRYMTKDIDNLGWLELFWAHHILTEEMDYEKVQYIIEIVEKRLKLISKKEDIWSFFYHFKGQFYWEKYQYYKLHLNYDFFYTNNDSLKKPTEKVRKEALSILNESHENYKNAIIQSQQNIHDIHQSAPSRANLGLVCIEVSKFYLFSDKEKCISYLDEAKEKFEEILEKDYNTYYGLARVHYYKGNIEVAQSYFKQFLKRIEFLNDKERLIIRNRFEDHMNIESKEFSGDGFPSKLSKNSH